MKPYLGLHFLFQSPDLPPHMADSSSSKLEQPTFVSSSLLLVSIINCKRVFQDLGYIPSFTNYFKDVKEEDENYNDDADSDNDEDDKDDGAQGLLVTTNQNILRSCIVATSEMHYEIFRIDKRPSYMGIAVLVELRRGDI
ncbi:hypothetical protein QVD17_36477 [Tagetes erecta]|uniref:Uncharacterized protein n=1 Tax=Tagetes erecta TaxID=13708 RepID=A0AAD8JWF1_TARER|nr:hypothetical protein QVD17_36477 [Tagetes erecta]